MYEFRLDILAFESHKTMRECFANAMNARMEGTIKSSSCQRIIYNRYQFEL